MSIFISSKQTPSILNLTAIGRSISLTACFQLIAALVSDQWLWTIFHWLFSSSLYTSVQFSFQIMSPEYECRLQVRTAIVSVDCTTGFIISNLSIFTVPRMPSYSSFIRSQPSIRLSWMGSKQVKSFEQSSRQGVGFPLCHASRAAVSSAIIVSEIVRLSMMCYIKLIAFRLLCSSPSFCNTPREHVTLHLFYNTPLRPLAL